MSPSPARRRNSRVELGEAEQRAARARLEDEWRDQLRRFNELQDELHGYLRRFGGPTTADENAALRRLGLSRKGVSVEAVCRAYRRLAKQAHPDTGGSADAFRRLKTDRDLALRVVGR